MTGRETIMTLTDAQKRLVIVGATGMVGGYALRSRARLPSGTER